MSSIQSPQNYRRSIAADPPFAELQTGKRDRVRDRACVYVTDALSRLRARLRLQSLQYARS